MRLLLPHLFLASALITTLPAETASKPLNKAWQVLHDCRLVEAGSNDGDSFKVGHRDQEFIIRLYYVDCPETYDTYIDRIKDQARYFSIPESSVIEFGKDAKKYTNTFLKNGFTVITRWEDARGGEEPRYFGIVRTKNHLLSTELVRNGLARIYGMPCEDAWPGGFQPWVYLKQLRHHEHTARQAGKGIWQSGTAQSTVLNEPQRAR